MPPHPLLKQDLAYLGENTEVSKSAFGLQAVGDPNFVFDLEAGREPRRKVQQKVLAFINGETHQQSAGAA